MINASFSTEIHRAGSDAVVEIRGELDDHTARQLRTILERLTADGAANVTLDVCRMTFIDSTGLGVIVGALKRCRSVGGDVTLLGPSVATRKVFELTGLDRVVTIVEDGSSR